MLGADWQFGKEILDQVKSLGFEQFPPNGSCESLVTQVIDPTYKAEKTDWTTRLSQVLKWPYTNEAQEEINIDENCFHKPVNHKISPQMDNQQEVQRIRREIQREISLSSNPIGQELWDNCRTFLKCFKKMKNYWAQGQTRPDEVNKLLETVENDPFFQEINRVSEIYEFDAKIPGTDFIRHGGNISEGVQRVEILHNTHWANKEEFVRKCLAGKTKINALIGSSLFPLLQLQEEEQEGNWVKDTAQQLELKTLSLQLEKEQLEKERLKRDKLKNEQFELKLSGMTAEPDDTHQFGDNRSVPVTNKEKENAENGNRNSSTPEADRNNDQPSEENLSMPMTQQKRKKSHLTENMSIPITKKEKKKVISQDWDTIFDEYLLALSDPEEEPTE